MSDLPATTPLPAPAAAQPEERAIIYVGAASVALIIGEKGSNKTKEYLDRPLPVARDTFRTGSISRATMEQAAAILRDYLQAVREFGLTLEQVRFYTTNILAEATNHEIFLNRLQVTTGLAVRLIDDGDMTRLIYQIALRLLSRNPKLAEKNTFVSHIGPGNTRALYFRKGRIAAYSSYRLGIFRAREAVASSGGGDLPQLAHIEEQIRGVVDHLAQDYSDMPMNYHVAIGSEIQSVAPHIAKPRAGASKIHEPDLEAYTEALAELNPDELVRKLHLHYTGSEGVIPSLQTNLALAKRFGDSFVLVPEGDFQRDLLLDLMEGTQTKTFQDEVIQAGMEIGKRYKTDRKHAEHVAAFARQLFRELRHLHALDPKYELILRVAAILHEIGMFVSPREHHKHSMYLILNTEVFGLSTMDRELVALLARYHRRYNPEPNHPHFSDLSREERMIVFKLAALLRIADALDRSHSQRIRSIHLRPDGNTLRIVTPGVEDTTVEQIAINSKCDLFREIYGYEIILSKT
jgi:exopolyphosphatase/guanosine-5'-triphosphate,3'-diphosphate pyrophosphatase